MQLKTRAKCWDSRVQLTLCDVSSLWSTVTTVCVSISCNLFVHDDVINLSISGELVSFIPRDITITTSVHYAVTSSITSRRAHTLTYVHDRS